MPERTTNAELLAALAEIKADLRHVKSIIGDEPGKGLRGDVAMLVGIKNKGWGLVVGLLLFAGGIGAAIKGAVGDLMK